MQRPTIQSPVKAKPQKKKRQTFLAFTHRWGRQEESTAAGGVAPGVPLDVCGWAYPGRTSGRPTLGLWRTASHPGNQIAPFPQLSTWRSGEQYTKKKNVTLWSTTNDTKEECVTHSSTSNNTKEECVTHWSTSNNTKKKCVTHWSTSNNTKKKRVTHWSTNNKTKDKFLKPWAANSTNN